MSRFTLSTPCQFWCLTIKAKHLIFVFSTNYCKGYHNLACVHKSSFTCVCVSLSLYKDTMTSPSNFPLFRPVAKIRHEKAWLCTPKTQKSSLYSGLFCSMPFLISGRREESCSSYLRWHGGFAPSLWSSLILFFWNLTLFHAFSLWWLWWQSDTLSETGWILFRLFRLKAVTW